MASPERIRRELEDISASLKEPLLPVRSLPLSSLLSLHAPFSAYFLARARVFAPPSPSPVLRRSKKRAYEFSAAAREAERKRDTLNVRY